MARRWVKIGAGMGAGITTILALFVFLQSQYGFIITDLTGDVTCEGTYEYPCISEFTVKNPTNTIVDVYSADQMKLEFSPDIYDYALFVPDGRCTATGSCACILKDGRKLGFEDWRCVDFTNKTKSQDKLVYNFRFNRYSTTTFRLAGIKLSPEDTIKWSFFTKNKILNPIWLPIEEEPLVPYRSSKTVCDNGKCKLTLWSGVREVYEDKQWKLIENARSLKDKGFNVVVLEDDVEFPIEVVDYNYTSIKVKLNPKGIKIFNEDIPIRVWDNNDTKAREFEQDVLDGKKVSKGVKDYKEKMDKIFEQEIGFNSLNQKKEMILEFGVGKILEFGVNSTTIILQDANTENLEDTYLDEYAGSTKKGGDPVLAIQNYSEANRHVVFKFDISSVPGGVTLQSSILGIYILTNNFDNSGEGFNISVHHLQNQSWIESGVDWNNFANNAQINQTFTDTIYMFGGTGEPTGWQSMNVFNSLNSAIGNAETNLSFYVKGHDVFGGPSVTDNILVTSKEYATAGLRPYLNITYTESDPNDWNTCGDLTLANTVYNITQDLSSATTCLYVKANNITIEGNGHLINYSTSYTGATLHAGVNIYGVNDSLVRNLTIISSDTSGDGALAFWIDSTTPGVKPYHATFEYINASGSGNIVGFDVEGSNHIIRNSYVFNASQYDMVVFNGNNITFENITSTGDEQIVKLGFEPASNITIKNYVASGDNLAYFTYGGDVNSNITIIDSVLNGAVILGDGEDITMINTTYSQETVDSGIIERYWYLTVNVTNTDFSPISSANVNISNVSDSIILLDETTGADGLTDKFTLISYVNNSGTTTNHYLYNITGWKTGYYTNSTTASLTTNLLTLLTLALLPDTCTYSSGDWNIDASDDCIISESVDIGGNDVYCTGEGSFTVNNNVYITNWNYRMFEDGCYYVAYGDGGFG